MEYKDTGRQRAVVCGKDEEVNTKHTNSQWRRLITSLWQGWRRASASRHLPSLKLNLLTCYNRQHSALLASPLTDHGNPFPPLSPPPSLPPYTPSQHGVSGHTSACLSVSAWLPQQQRSTRGRSISRQSRCEVLINYMEGDKVSAAHRGGLQASPLYRGSIGLYTRL